MATTNIKRSALVVSDYLGIDPLLDIAYKAIAKLPVVKNHTVMSDERGRPDFISYKAYKTTDFWWVVLLYNKIYCASDIVEGLVLNLPAYPQLISVINNAVNYTETDYSALQTSVTI